MTVVGGAASDGALQVHGAPGRLPLPQLERARSLFEPHLPCEPPELRRVYLRLALQFHPDKRPEDERVSATELFQAIAAVYEDLCDELNPQQERGARSAPRVKSPVAAAAELGDLVELRRLLESRPDAAVEPDDLGVYPVMFAAAGGCTEAVDVLLEFGADVNARNPIKWSVLLYGALGNHAEMVKFLVDRGAEVSEHELILAAYTGNPESLEAMCKLYRGSIPDLLTDQSRKTLLHLACEGMCFLRHTAERHAACVDCVLRWGAPVDTREPKLGRTALQDYIGDVRWRTRALENSPAHMGVVERLCAAGACVKTEDNAGDSALSLAVAAGLGRVRGLLLSYA